jgi:hypothetical protein
MLRKKSDFISEESTDQTLVEQYTTRGLNRVLYSGTLHCTVRVIFAVVISVPDVPVTVTV